MCGQLAREMAGRRFGKIWFLQNLPDCRCSIVEGDGKLAVQAELQSLNAEKMNERCVLGKFMEKSVLQTRQDALHMKFGVGKVQAILEIFALAAIFPGVYVDVHAAIPIAGAQRVDDDLEHFSAQWLSELKLFQVRINSAEAILHWLLVSHSNSHSRRRDRREKMGAICVIAEKGAAEITAPS